jgi:hypothetical protein
LKKGEENTNGQKHEWSDLNNQHRIGVIHKKVGSIEEEIGGEAHGGASDS